MVLDDWKSAVIAHNLTSFIPYDASAFIRQSKESRILHQDGDPDVRQIEEVVIKAPNITWIDQLNPGGRQISVDEKLNGGLGFTKITDMLMGGRVPGLFRDGGTWKWRGMTVSFLTDGTVMVDEDALNSMSPLDVEFIELVPAHKNSFKVAAVNFIFRKGPRPTRPAIGIDQASIRGFYEAREFYSPNYAIREENHILPDKRTTLYWEPMVITDEQGRASVAFFTGDVPGRYRVVAEGITATGYPGTASVIFEVK